MLKIENLQKNYKSFLLDATLEVKKGKISALVGANGAGKSTIFKAVLGLIRADGGKVTLFGKDVNMLDIASRERIGAVLAESGFSGYVRVSDVKAMLKSMYKNFDEDFFDSEVKKLKLPMNKKIKEFSTGMKAKLKMLAAMSHNADLLILDEPTAGLDVIARDDLLTLLREYIKKNANASVLISSHISSDLESICDDVYMINDGKIVLHEDIDAILHDYAIIKANDNTELDTRYALYKKSEDGACFYLTNNKQYYIENYENLIAEKASIDGVILMIIKGEKL